MRANDLKADIASWLINVHPESSSSNLPTNRKRNRDNVESSPNLKRPRLRRTSTRAVFAHVDPNTLSARMDLRSGPGDRSSPRKSPRKPSPSKNHQNPSNTAAEPPKTPKNPKNPERSLKRHAKPTTIPAFIPPHSPPSSEPLLPNDVEQTSLDSSSHRASTTADDLVSTSPAKTTSSSGPKLVNNVRNVRESLGEEGFYFEDEESYNKYPEIQELIEEMFFTERASAMRTESLLKIQKWRKENATAPEDKYFAKLLPQVVGESRTTFSTEASSQRKSFSFDELEEASKVMLNRGVLYKEGKSIEKKLGLTNPVPDLVWGLKVHQNPSRNAPRLGNTPTALIKLAPGVRYPFFVMEDKGPDEPIEAAENQAIRSGGALVEARRELKRLARGKDETEAVGVDLDCIAFSCSWVPQQANIHVHWHELTKEGYSIWHMNFLQGYKFSKSSDMVQFRHDIHNILDWGVSPARKTTLRALEIKLAAKHA